MKTKVNRPSGKQQRDTGVTRLIQNWYDNGYEDALTDQANLFTQTEVDNECWKAEIRLLHSIQTGEYDISHLLEMKKEEKPVYPILEEAEIGLLKTLLWTHKEEMEKLEAETHERLERIEDGVQQRAAHVVLKFKEITERLISIEAKVHKKEIPF